MPRANRYFIPAYTWHITHRCQKQAFLLKFVRDRKKWISWGLNLVRPQKDAQKNQSAAWKVMIAYYLKRHTAVTNRWDFHYSSACLITNPYRRCTVYTVIGRVSSVKVTPNCSSNHCLAISIHSSPRQYGEALLT